MIAFLRGRVLEKHPNRVIVDVAGVGYDLAVPLSTFYTAGEPGLRSVCECTPMCAKISSRSTDSPRRSNLTVFERLIAISGIGPKLALAVLSGIEPRELVTAIQRGDLVRMTDSRRR